MADYTITSSAYLRNNYSAYRQMSIKASRDEATQKELSTADSLALKKAIRSLSDYKYNDEDAEDSDEENIKFYKTLKAFADTYNYTLDSSSSSASKSIKDLGKKMKSFASKYGDELSELGVKFNSKGYMEVSASAVDNIKQSTFGETFSSSSAYKTNFLNELNDVAKNVYRRIDTYL